MRYQSYRYFLPVLVKRKKKQLLFFFTIGFLVYLFSFSILSTVIEIRNNEYYRTIPKEPQVTLNVFYPLEEFEEQLGNLQILMTKESELGVSFIAFFEVQFNSSRPEITVVLVTSSKLKESNETVSIPYQGSIINVSALMFQDDIFYSKINSKPIVSYSDLKEQISLNSTTIRVSVLLMYKAEHLDKSLFSLTNWIENNIETTIIKLEKEKFDVFIFKNMFINQEKFMIQFVLSILSFFVILAILLTIAFITLSIELERLFLSQEKIITIFEYRGQNRKGLIILIVIVVMSLFFIGLGTGLQLLSMDVVQRREFGLISLGFGILFVSGYYSSGLRRRVWFFKDVQNALVILYFAFSTLIYTIDRNFGSKMVWIGIVTVFIFLIDKVLFKILEFLINIGRTTQRDTLSNLGLDIFKKTITKKETQRSLFLIILIFFSLNAFYPLIDSEQTNENQWGTVTLTVENLTYWDFINWKQTNNLSFSISGLALIPQITYSKETDQFNLAIVDKDFSQLTLGAKPVSPDLSNDTVQGILSDKALKHNDLKLGDKIRANFGYVSFMFEIIESVDFLHPFTYSGNNLISGYVSFLEFNKTILSSIPLSFLGIQGRGNEDKTMITNIISSSLNRSVTEVSFDINQKSSLIHTYELLPQNLILLNFVGSILLFSFSYLLIWREFIDQLCMVSRLLEFRGFKKEGFSKSFGRLYFFVSIVVIFMANMLILGYEILTLSIPRIIFLSTKLNKIIQNALVQNILLLLLFLVNYLVIYGYFKVKSPEKVIN